MTELRDGAPFTRAEVSILLKGGHTLRLTGSTKWWLDEGIDDLLRKIKETETSVVSSSAY